MSIKRAALLALCALCIGAVLLSLRGTPAVFEYNILSPRVEKPEPAAPSPEEQESGGQPKEEKPSALSELLKDLDAKAQDLGGVLSAYGAAAYLPSASCSDPQSEKEPKAALLKGIWGARLHPDGVLVEGRQLYLEEIEKGSPCAVINEWLAINLYRIGNPVGRKLRVGEAEFTVVGVVKSARTVGDREPGLVLAPLLALDKAGIQTRMLSVLMQPTPGSGAYAALSQAMAKWQEGGDFYSLPKEAYRVRLPLRLLLCALGALVVAVTLRLSGLATKSLYQGGKHRLERRYAVNMLPEIIGRALLILLMYAVNAAAIALILQALIAPVYIFPEWVPGRLVDPGKIAETFWILRGQENGLLSLRTPELLRLRYLHRLMTVFCSALFFLLLRPYYLWKKRVFD